MDRQGEALELIRNVVLEEAGRLGVRVNRIILFGSRARGEARGDSDYDILIIVEDGVERRIRRRLAASVSRRLYEELEADADVVVVTHSHWSRYSRVPGTILYPAREEGITIG